MKPSLLQKILDTPSNSGATCNPGVQITPWPLKNKNYTGIKGSEKKKYEHLKKFVWTPWLRQSCFCVCASAFLLMVLSVLPLLHLWGSGSLWRQWVQSRRTRCAKEFCWAKPWKDTVVCWAKVLGLSVLAFIFMCCTWIEYWLKKKEEVGSNDKW